MNNSIKFLIVGTERSGSTMLSGILANSGADFGFEKGRDWYRGSGDYEHPIIVDNFKYIKRSIFFSKFSDRLKRIYNDKVTSHMLSLFNSVSFAKYPPLCYLLPYHVNKAGFDIRLIVIIRKFNDFTVSRISKNGGDFFSSKETYINLYSTALYNLSIFGGCVVCYEDLIDPQKEFWADLLEKTCKLDYDLLIQERNKIIKPTASANNIDEISIDSECDLLYEKYKGLAGKLFVPSKSKQH